MLAISFFVVALLYSTVGFGGGSSYLAILAVADVPYEIVPKLSLICNLLVVAGGCWHYHRKGHFNKNIILPFVLTSVPMALIGGMYPLREKTFTLLLASSLVMAGIRLLFVSGSTQGEVKSPPLAVAAIVGAALGLLSGLVGLGGGIFLSPLMLNLKWARPKEISATSSAFILLNSAAGLLGQLTKGIPGGLTEYWPLFVAVVAGGQLGSWSSNHKRFSHSLVQKGTAVLILFISTRLLYKLLVNT